MVYLKVIYLVINDYFLSIILILFLLLIKSNKFLHLGEVEIELSKVLVFGTLVNPKPIVKFFSVLEPNSQDYTIDRLLAFIKR